MKARNQGIIFIICSAFFFALMNLFVKLAGDVPSLQKVFFRNSVAVVVSFCILLKNRQDFKVPKAGWKYVVIRSVAGTLGMICNFYAIDHMNIADASILNKLSPFFAIIFSYFVLKEKASPVDWIAVAAAFVGALFVVKPSFSAEVIPALAGVLGGLGAGLAYTYLRKAANSGVKGPFVVFFFSLFSCVVTSPYLIFNYFPMTWQQLIFLICAGAAATGGQLFITAAYVKAPAKEISVFDYSIVVFAGGLGFFFLDEVPDVFSFVGYVVIIGVAVFKWLYKSKKEKRESFADARQDRSEKDESEQTKKD